MEKNNLILISDGYRSLNTKLHLKSKNFGSDSDLHSEIVYHSFLKPYRINRFLDYGCGKGGLTERLNTLYKCAGDNYDPCVDKFFNVPADTYQAVLCIDVFEHIEPEYIDNVLKHIYSLTTAFGYFSIGLGPSNKTLEDGRNAHILINNKEWWLSKLKEQGFTLVTETNSTYVNRTEKKHPPQTSFAGIFKKDEKLT